MNRKEKREFIRSLTRAVTRDVLAKVSQMPDAWDGLELRELLADEFNRERHMTRGAEARRDYRRRLKEYRNVRATTTV